MDEPTLPAQLVEARRRPLFDFATLPDALVVAALVDDSGIVGAASIGRARLFDS